jgi:hypothetical protein
MIIDTLAIIFFTLLISGLIYTIYAVLAEIFDI